MASVEGMEQRYRTGTNRLREHLTAERARLSGEQMAAAIRGESAQVQLLDQKLQQLVDDLNALEIIDLAATLKEAFVFPGLPANHPELLKRATQEVAEWKHAQEAISGATEQIARAAHSALTLAKLVAKYAPLFA